MSTPIVLTGPELTQEVQNPSPVERERGILWKMEKAQALIEDGYREGWTLFSEAVAELETYLLTCPLEAESAP